MELMEVVPLTREQVISCLVATTEALSPFVGPRILAEAQDVLRAA